MRGGWGVSPCVLACSCAPGTPQQILFTCSRLQTLFISFRLSHFSQHSPFQWVTCLIDPFKDTPPKEIIFWILVENEVIFGVCRTRCYSCQEPDGSFMETWVWIYFSHGHSEVSLFRKKEIWFASSLFVRSICSFWLHCLQPFPTLLCLLEDGSQGLRSALHVGESCGYTAA